MPLTIADICAPLPPAPRAKIWVARYHPSDPQSPDHWTIFIEDDGRDTIQQVKPSKHGRYAVAPVKYGLRPQDDCMWKCSILVGEIESWKVRDARDCIQNEPVKSVGGRWNGQSWVMGALEALHGACLVDVKGSAVEYLREKRQR